MIDKRDESIISTLRSGSPNFGILLTDGAATLEKDKTIPEAIKARMDGVHLILVSPEGTSDNLEFKGIASDPDEANLHTVKHFSQLPDIQTNIIGAMCNCKTAVSRITMLAYLL